jgi:hypothetical protein
MSAADAPLGPTRADKIVVAVTQAIIAAQRGGHESTPTAWVDTTATLEALAVVAARIALQIKIAVTTADGGEFAEWIADRIHQNFNALRKTHDKHPFAPLGGRKRMAGGGQRGMDDRVRRGHQFA